MSKPLTLAILVFPGCQVLDVTGPASVFESSNDISGQAHYTVHILSADGGAVRTNGAIGLMTKSIKELPPRSIDTLLIPGGDETGLQTLAAEESVREWVVQVSTNARRYGSICTGTFALAYLDLLGGKRRVEGRRGWQAHGRAGRGRATSRRHRDSGTEAMPFRRG